MNTRQKTPIDLHRWCCYIVYIGHITATLIVLAHVIWYFAARSVLAWPRDVYLRSYIIVPAIGFFILNALASACVHSNRISLLAKEYLSLSLFVICALYLSLTHDIANVLLCSYILPIFASTVFSNVKLTRRIFFMSAVAVLLPGVKMYFAGTLDSNILMEIFVSCFMFLCSYLLAKLLIEYGQNNLATIIRSHEEANKNELAFLQAQIKPHFLYNAINTVVSFCYTDSERAARLLVDFSKYLRFVFDVDHKSMMVPLDKEIELIQTYVAIEKARFGELIRVNYEINPELTHMEIPSFCLQPLVENAIKHGLRKKKDGGTVRVCAKKSGEDIVIQVADTGIGMSVQRLDRLKNNALSSEGVGFLNVEKRIQNWKDARLAVQSKQGEGTIVTITVSDGTA